MIAYHTRYPSEILTALQKAKAPLDVDGVIRLCAGEINHRERTACYASYLTKLNKLAKDGLVTKTVIKVGRNRRVKFQAIE